jgi:hypothetical protein
MDEAVRSMLQACTWVAPTSREQQGFVQLLWRMQEAGEEPKEILIGLASALADGLRHGNWPS